MSSKILLTSILTILALVVSAQKPVITLTFTAENNGQNIPLDSILIENLTQGGDTTLYAPDNVLNISYELGIGEIQPYGDKGFSLSQNYPNPIQHKTSISLRLPEGETVLISLCNIMGRELLHREYTLGRGIHFFNFYPGRENVYFLTARAEQQSRTIKMFNSPLHASFSGTCLLEYNGQPTNNEDFKSANNLNNFVFDLGDQLQYKASSALGNRTITDSPAENQTYTFQFGSAGVPCPGLPTVNDIDGNIYNTVLIGSQCWLAENLKTTKFRNGIAIPNVTDVTVWSNLTTRAYVWYDNNISWKGKYGALYNWYATVDVFGLCPSGWHVPTDIEWTYLIDYIGGSPDGDELKSCRQENSPLGGGCNTTEHPRWNSSSINWGSDDYGFSGLPGGARNYDGNFSNIGGNGYWWSSTEDSSFIAWGRFLDENYGDVGVIGFSKRGGFSVRCLRD